MDLTNKQVNVTDKPWGYEIKWAHTKNYVGKILHVKKGHRLSLQYHKEKEETIMISTGLLLFTYGNSEDDLKTVELIPGDTFHIPTGMIHRMEGLEDTDVIEVSTPQLTDIVRLVDDYKRI